MLEKEGGGKENVRSRQKKRESVCETAQLNIRVYLDIFAPINTTVWLQHPKPLGSVVR